MPDSPTRTRPGTAGPTTWVRTHVKVEEVKARKQQRHSEKICCFIQVYGCLHINLEVDTRLPLDTLTLELWAGCDFLSRLTLTFTFVAASLTDYHRCQKTLGEKGVDMTPCDWHKRVYTSLCPKSWVIILLTFIKPNTAQKTGDPWAGFV